MSASSYVDYLTLNEITGHPVDAPLGLNLYRQSLQTLCAMSLEPLAEGADYSLHIRSYQCGPILVLRSQLSGDGFDFSRPVRKMNQIRADSCALRLSLVGGEQIVIRGEMKTLLAGEAYLADLAHPDDLSVTTSDSLQIVIPRHRLGVSEAELERMQGRILAADSAAGLMLAGHLSALWASLPEVRLGEADVIGQATISLIIGLMQATRAEPTLQSATDSSLVHRLHLYIAANLTRSDLDAQHLAREFGLSRAALYRLFGASGGVADYIRQRRLRDAMRILSSGTRADDSLTALAHDLGFPTLASFNRAFKARYAVSPRSVRRGLGL